MDRRDYLQALDRALRPLVPQREREDILRYYSEYFDEAGPEREDAVIALLGDPVELARSTAQGAKPYPLPEEGRPDPDDPAERGVSPKRLLRWAKRHWRWLAAGCAGLLAVVVLATALGSQEDGAPAGFPDMEPARPEGAALTACMEPTVLEASFTNVLVDVDVANIRIRQGEAQALSLQWKQGAAADYGFSYCIKDGLLYISGGSPEETVDVDALDAWVEITVAQGTELEQVAVHAGIGDIEISNVEAWSVLAHTGIGDISLRGGWAGPTYASLYSGAGNIYQSGPPVRKLWAETEAGNAWLRPLCAEDACSYDLRAGGTAGLVTVNGAAAGGRASQAKRSSGSGLGVERPYDFTVTTKKGNIALEFSYS